jgi:hypothetical protein
MKSSDSAHNDFFEPTALTYVVTAWHQTVFVQDAKMEENYNLPHTLPLHKNAVLRCEEL